MLVGLAVLRRTPTTTSRELPMYIFSVNATTKKARDHLQEGQRVPFIVYIHFIDLFGAEQLCKIYLMRAGFTDIEIEKRKLVPSHLIKDERVVTADKAMAEAIKSGYMIQMFDE
jgi:hypothetical protein